MHIRYNDMNMNYKLTSETLYTVKSTGHDVFKFHFKYANENLKKRKKAIIIIKIRKKMKNIQCSTMRNQLN